MSEREYEKMSASEKKKEDWMNSKWRPMMGWTYMGTCICDFVVFPILWSLLQTVIKQPLTQWNPLTLQGAGLFHIAMGAVLGIAAYGRTQEKMIGANNGGAAALNTNAAPSFSSIPQSVAPTTFPTVPDPSAIPTTAVPTAPSTPVRKIGKPVPQQSQDPVL